MANGEHVSVMLKEAVDALCVRPGGLYVDGTFGRGGHTREILARGGRVLAIDRDDAAVAAGAALKASLGGAGERLAVVKGNHGEIGRICEREGFHEVDGVLLDLGVSSPQLDEAGRGFSFQREGPLDMRMDRSRGLTAADLVNGWDAARLAETFRAFGEEPQARRLAQAIVRARGAGRAFETTTDLAEFVERLVGRRGPHHPATRVFQALRMAVNDEMGELSAALAGGLGALRAGGRFAVITFESLTDRAVKVFFAEHVGREESLLQGGAAWRGALPKVRPVTRKPVVPGEGECQSNPRARSAKLRVIERE